MKKSIITIFVLFIIYIYVSFVSLLPQSIVLLSGENINLKSLPGISKSEIVQTVNENIKNSTVEVKLLDNIMLKNISVTTLENMEVVPVGKIIGLKLYTNGILIVGFSEIEDINKNSIKPYKDSGVKEGDTIIGINNKEIEDIKSLKEIVNNSGGEDIELKLLRNGNVITTSMRPVEVGKKEYKLGLWVKDAATGVGTITFYEPQSQMFAALGHGITDSDTNQLVHIDSGEAVTSKILTIKKGENGVPGEIRGTIVNQSSVGEVYKNTSFGVYGKLNNLSALNIDLEEKKEIALRNEIEIGNAQILCTADDSNIAKEYDIEIQKIYYNNNENNKSMLIKIVDNELLNKTGGIIRGLSGAPIIQNGKFIGAITNVLVSNPEIGYAVFADLMIKEINIK